MEFVSVGRSGLRVSCLCLGTMMFGGPTDEADSLRLLRRALEQLEDNLEALTVTITPEDEAAVDRLVPPGEQTGWGFNDPNYPVRGRPRA